MLANSPGCRAEWLGEFASACQKFGEPAGGITFSRAIFSLRIDNKNGPWMIVGASLAGQDDRGRPGALAFHGLFIEERSFQKIGFDPFAIASELRFHFDVENTSCRAGYYRPSPTKAADNNRPCEPSNTVVRRLAGGRRVAIESPEPIENLARQVWADLPEKIRKKTSMATWAFANGNHFDMVAVPKLEAIEWDASYAETKKGDGGNKALSSGKKILLLRWIIPSVPFFLAGVVFLAWKWKASPHERPVSPIASNVAAIPSATGPDPASYRDEISNAAEIRGVAQSLAEFAERFGIPLDGDPPDPTSSMIRLADRLRYRGPLLTEAELAQLAKENVPGRSRAMAWDALIRRFVADLPLPKNFREGPLRWKLDTFAWSFHLDPFERLPTTDIPKAMSDALTLDEPPGANPLASRYPTLAEYARFLAKLPTR